MTMRWRLGLAGLLAGLGMAGSAWAHGDVMPHAMDTAGLTALGEDLQGENPYRGQPDYTLAQEIGAKGFNQNCARCHGLGAVSGGIAPDLRLLVPVDDDGYFIGRVMSGSIRNGVTYMPPFEGCPQPGGDLGDPLLARHGGRAAVKLGRRATLAGLAAFVGPLPAQARIYADTVNTVGESLDQIRAKGRLRIGVYADFAPFSAASASGPQGIDVEIARLIADRLGVRLELVVVQAGDTVDDDLRNHVWRGTVVDHAVVNLLLHVPYSRELEIRSELAVLVQPYFTETLVIARDRAKCPTTAKRDLEALAGLRIGVELDSLPDFYLGSTLDGRLRDGVVHYRRPEEALAALLAGEIAAFMGLRSQVEAGLGDQAGRFELGPLPLPGLRLTSWAVGAAVRENARDLGYAAGDILAAAVKDGTVGRDLPGARHRLPAAAFRLGAAPPATTTFLQVTGILRALTCSALPSQGAHIMTRSRSTDRHHPGAAGDGLGAGAGRHRPGPARRRPDHRATSSPTAWATRRSATARSTRSARRTVKRLVPAWTLSFGGEKQRGQESQPLVSDGTLYVTASYSRMFAVDARTGEEKWQYDARLPDGILPCCDVVNRGAAIYGDKVYFTTLDAQLVALNKDTGKVVWRKKMENYQDGYSNTAAPLIVKGKVIVGNSGGEFGDRRRGQGLRCRDRRGGLVPADGRGQHGSARAARIPPITGTTNATWPGDMWQHGGAATWLGGTYDPELNLLFFGTGQPAPWNSWLRPGDNLYSSSTLAIDPDSGEIKWHFQGTPHDGWDFDGVNEFIPFELEKDGKKIHAGAKADRNGFFFVLDRTNGEFISASPFVSKITWAKGYGDDGRPLADPTSRPKSPTEPKAEGAEGRRPCSTRPASSAPRTGCRWPTARRPACSTSPATSGAWTSGTRTSPTRRVPPISAPASTSSRSTTTISACCAPSTRPPARSSSRSTTAHRCGAAC